MYDVTDPTVMYDLIRTYLVRPNGMCPIVDIQMVVTVQLQEVKTKHEALEDRVSLEGDDAVEVPLVLRPQEGAVNLPVHLLQEVTLA